VSTEAGQLQQAENELADMLNGVRIAIEGHPCAVSEKTTKEQPGDGD
jgi:hypothetical protein